MARTSRLGWIATLFSGLPRNLSSSDSKARENDTPPKLNRYLIQRQRGVDRLKSHLSSVAHQSIKPSFASQLRRVQREASFTYRIRPRQAAVPLDFLRTSAAYSDPWWSEEPIDNSIQPSDQPTELDSDEAIVGERTYSIHLLDGQEIKHIRREYVVRGRRFKRFYAVDKDGNEILFDHIPHQILPLYGVERISDQVEHVVVCEGAVAADAVFQLDVPAVGTLTGALYTPSSESLLPLRQKSVLLWPDNDDVGVHHMLRIAALLTDLGTQSVKMIRWVGGPPKGDAADFRGTREDLERMLDEAVLWRDVAPIGSRGVLQVHPPRSPVRLELPADARPAMARLAAEPTFVVRARVRRVVEEIGPLIDMVQRGRQLSIEDQARLALAIQNLAIEIAGGGIL